MDNPSNEELKKCIEDLMQCNIQKVLTGESKSEELLFCKPYDVEIYMESIGSQELEDFNTNGSDWDFWGTFEYKYSKYQISGDGYSNNHIVFKKVN